MWKKSEIESQTQGPTVFNPPSERKEVPADRAVIGSSIVVRGEVSGGQDLLIQGQVEGTVNLPTSCVTVGQSGTVRANILAKVIRVEGEVFGDLHASEQVVIIKSGNIRGNVQAPRVTLEDGAKVKGTIDMDCAREAEEDAPNRSDIHVM